MTTTTLTAANRPDRRSFLLALGVSTSVLLLAGALLVPLSLGGPAPSMSGPLASGTPGGVAGPAGPVHGGGGGGAAAEAALNRQSAEEVAAKSGGCMSCHLYEGSDRTSMHVSPAVSIGCTDCHGGDASVFRSAGDAPGTQPFEGAKQQAHVQPLLDIWTSSANPELSYAATLQESAEFIRFVNPGDLRVVDQTCASCHRQETYAVQKSMMRNGAMLYGAALYNNGSFPFKNPLFGEQYMPDGQAATVYNNPEPTPEETRDRGILPLLLPLPRWEVTQPGNVFRIFERGGFRPAEVGNPSIDEEPGRPKSRLSNRGFGTLNRTDPIVIGAQKTRLVDPTLNFMGTNEQPGDYRSGGCSSCHVVYANDRSTVHSEAAYAFTNEGTSRTSDPMIPGDESGHPVNHVFTAAVPTSQCMTCHVHPGTNMAVAYQGLTWWDNETDGERMYPAETIRRSGEEIREIELRNPEGSAVKGLWSDPEFLKRTGTEEFNSALDRTVFADFHGHGWMYRAVFKRDRKGNLLDAQGSVVSDASPQQLWEAMQYSTAGAQPAAPPPGAPVHLKDIHLERGMHCVDCHFKRDSHGDGNLYGEPRNMIEIACRDCHGTVSERATLVTSGPGAPPGGTDLTQEYTGRFQRRGNQLTQVSTMDNTRRWTIPQLLDSLDGDNERAALAHSIQKDGVTWGEAGAPADVLAHAGTQMTCQSCHSSWVTSCFGCHLAQRANEKKPMLHYEAETTRNWTQYNYQVLRDDIFMLGIDGSVIGNTVSPVRSSSALVVSSQDANRNWVYFQQQTVSAEGYAGQAFNTHVPHTVRKTETKYCSDCHVSEAGDNNAIMAQLLTLGTSMTNFFGRFVFVGTGEGGVEAVAVTELDEPQAVIGSDLHRIAYPEAYAEHAANDRELTLGVHHGSSNALDVQHRGEYLYIADGEGGFKAFDIAQLNQKGFSEKIVSAPFSPLGQSTNVGTRFATAVASPSTMLVDANRLQLPVNEEQSIHPMYRYIYISDREEGLVVSTAMTLLDGNPANNFLERAAAFNPNGALDGAVSLTIAGHYAYVLCDRGLVVVDIDDPLNPSIVGEVGAPQLRDPRAIEIQFRYAFITDDDGLKIVEVTDPTAPRFVEGATVELDDARGIYVARTYAYIAGGAQGLVIVDVERPEAPFIDQVFNAGGAIDDANDVKVGMTNASVFAYIADGRNGLRVVQLVSANRTEGAFGFSPRPTPELIASFHTHEPALSISRGLDRDRAVDETGNQVAVFGRRGGRPFNLEEMQRLFLRDGEVWTVDDMPPAPPATSGLSGEAGSSESSESWAATLRRWAGSWLPH